MFKSLQKLSLLLVALLYCVGANAATEIVIDGIKYQVSTARYATVIRNTEQEYSGDIVIPETITFEGRTKTVQAIDQQAFWGCRELTSVKLPETIRTIGYAAFAACGRLTSVNIPEKVQIIQNETFSGCRSLASITIPESVSNIYDEAFRDCYSLTSVTIPQSVKNIGVGAFSGCDGLESFYGKYASEDNRCLIKNGELISFAPAGLTSYNIHESVTSIGVYAFYGCSALTSITIPESVTSIGNHAFEYCSSLPSITIPQTVTTIGSWAFSNCYGFTSITLPESVTTIGSEAFYRCESLTTITIPETVTSIGPGVLKNCPNLETIDSKLASDDHRCLILNGTLLAFAPVGLTTYDIPASVTSIAVFVFERCNALTSVTIPASLTMINQCAFASCEALTSITCLATVPPVCEPKWFGAAPKGCTLRVPTESVEAYKAAEWWKDFENIEGIDATGINSAEAETNKGVAYSLSGSRVGEGYKGIVIRDGKKILRK